MSPNKPACKLWNFDLNDLYPCPIWPRQCSYYILYRYHSNTIVDDINVFWTRMHSSRMHTAPSLTVSRNIWGEVCAAPLDADPPGCRPPSPRCRPPGCRPPSRMKTTLDADPLVMWPVMHTGKPPPLWTEWQTGVKTLPSQTSFEGGKHLPKYENSM